MPNLVYLALVIAEFNAFIQTENAQIGPFIDISHVYLLPMSAERKKLPNLILK